MAKTNGSPTPRAPGYLRPATRRWWTSVVTTWTLEQHHVRLLTLAAEAWDRGQQAREVIMREGLTTPTRDGGAKLHPACRVEGDSRLAFARLIRELDLDLEPPKVDSRPPKLRSIIAG
jgi:phage terminase small subunit